MVRSRSCGVGGAGGPGEQGVAHGAAHQGEAPPGRGKAARHLLGGLDVGAEPFGDGRGLHPPTVVRPLASPCVDAPGQDRPLHARGGRRSPGQHPGRRRRGSSGAGARRRRAPRAGLPDTLGERRPALVQPRSRRVPVRGRGEQPAGQPDLLRTLRRRLRPAAGAVGHALGHTAVPGRRRPRHRRGRSPHGRSLRDRPARLERECPVQRARDLRGRRARGHADLGLHAVHRRVRRRLRRLGRARAVGLVVPALPLHHVSHLPATERHVARAAVPCASASSSPSRRAA